MYKSHLHASYQNWSTSLILNKVHGSTPALKVNIDAHGIAREEKNSDN